MSEQQLNRNVSSEQDKLLNDEMEIDLMDILRKIISIRKTLYKAAGIGLIMGIIVAFSIPKQYTVKVTLSPEMGNSKGTNGIAGLLAQLGELWREQEHYLDLDGFPLTPYVKERINVSQCSEFCPHSSYCRFASFSRRWLSESYDFQISNHNYILADVVNRREGKKKLLPYYNM